MASRRILSLPVAAARAASLCRPSSPSRALNTASLARNSAGDHGSLWKNRSSTLSRRAYSTADEAAKQEAEFEPVSEEQTKPQEEKILSETERVTGPIEHHSFKAETKRLLDIVAHSLYTDREVFVRELASNASDACEKLRYLILSDPSALDYGVEHQKLEINISVDKPNGIFIIQDSGVGMTLEEVNENLGTIARSGTKAFVESLETSKDTSKTAKDNLIGQFGVGFYSALMVADKIKVYTRSARKGSKGYCWSTDGSGSYDVAEAEGVSVGTKIVLHLKDDSRKFADKFDVENIIKKYSSFISFPIHVNGSVVNTVGALWTKSPSEITDEQHKEFYRFVAHAYDEPQYRLQYRTDSPLNIRALLYVPERHTEIFGMGRMEPGVNLYSRKVLIQAKSKKLLPEWCRFVKGVVDSEDIPLNISREHMQDSMLINKLRDVVTTRICKWLDEESRRDADKYLDFWRDFGLFIKEGVCVDAAHRKDIAKLLRYETSLTEAGKPCSLKDYVSRMQPDQKMIFYVLSPSRQIALESPYCEPLIKKGYEIIFSYETVDEFVWTNLSEYDGKKIVSVESREAQELVKAAAEEEAAKDASAAELSKEEKKELCDWFDGALGDLISEVVPTSRAASIPALIVDPTSAVMRRMMAMAPGSPLSQLPLPPQKLEINTLSPVILGINSLRKTDEPLAKMLAEQIMDNALIAAGLLDDPRSMTKRLNSILEKLVSAHGTAEGQKKE
ncbi:heat shock protein Hsp90 family protein [Hyaloraphidium curvatum]|nr:heat shock protein Hsp90 family protein [Hyaloraphidium curvatum]